MDIRGYGDYISDLVLLMASGNLSHEDFVFINRILLDKIKDNKDMYKWGIYGKEKEIKRNLYHRTINLKNRGVLSNEEMRQIKIKYVEGMN